MTIKSFKFAAGLTCAMLTVLAMTGCSIQISLKDCTLENNSCNQNQYCMFAEGNCGQDNATGTCQALPEVCTEIFSPVCGCDGETYANNCQAAGAGMNVQSSGECAGG